MRVLVEVIDRPLSLRGPIYHVGERLFLDTDIPAQRQVLEARGWVRRVEGPAVASAPPAPPMDRMMRAPVAAKGTAKPAKVRKPGEETA